MMTDADGSDIPDEQFDDGMLAQELIAEHDEQGHDESGQNLLRTTLLLVMFLVVSGVMFVSVHRKGHSESRCFLEDGTLLTRASVDASSHTSARA